MKLRNIFTLLAAALSLAFVGCQEQERFLDEVKVSKSYVAIPVKGGEMKIQVDASAEWNITAWDAKAEKNIEIPEWLTITPMSGAAGKSEVTFAAAATAETREVMLHLDCCAASQVLNVMQMASKPEAALTTCKFVLENGVIDQFYRIKAKVAEIPLADFQKYGKFYISDDSTAEKVQIYGCANKSEYLESNNPTIAVGDVVVIEGSWSKYGNFNNDTQILSVEKSLIKAEKVIPSTPLPVEGGVVTVVLTVKGDDLAVEIPETATWLTAGEPTIIGTSTFVELTAAPNEGDPRSTTVDFKTTSKGETYVATVTVEQKAGVIAEPEIATIASVLALEVDATVADGTVIEGVVISNAALGNLTSKKGMYVQDETGGLQLRFNADHEFAFGDKVKIDLSGAKFGKYNEAVQVSNVANEKVTVVSKGNAVKAKTVSVADFLANKYEGQYVAIEGVQVVEADLAKKFVEGDAHTSINLETVGGQNFIEFSSKYATYGTTAVPQGSGTIKGISARNKDAIQIIFAQESDFAGLTGSRFVPGQEPETPVTPGPGETSEVKILTNAEICAAMTSSSTSYVNYTIESASGVWSVNASQNKENTFLQCRGKKGGYIKTPAFDKDIKSVTIHFTTKKSVYPDNTYCVFPATWTAPTADAAYPDTGNVGKAVTDGTQSLTIPVAAGNKQVYISIIGTYSYYLDHIDVAF